MARDEDSAFNAQKIGTYFCGHRIYRDVQKIKPRHSPSELNRWRKSEKWVYKQFKLDIMKKSHSILSIPLDPFLIKKYNPILCGMTQTCIFEIHKIINGIKIFKNHYVSKYYKGTKFNPNKKEEVKLITIKKLTDKLNCHLIKPWRENLFLKSSLFYPLRVN